MKSIRTALLLLLMLPLTIVAAFVSLETFYASRKISNELSDRTLLAAMLTISENVVSSNGTLLADTTLAMLTENLGDEFFYHVRGPDGAFVTGYSGYPKPPGEPELEVGIPFFYGGVHQGEAVRVVKMRQLLIGRELNGITTITTWQKISKRSDFTLSLFTRSLMRLALLVLAAGTIVWFALSFGLRPLTRLQSAIESRTPDDLTPIKRAMPIELTEIVNSMNELFARVARSKKNRERFIGDAAHQLRNPIAAIKVQAQSSLESEKKTDMKSGLQNIVEVADKSAKMITQMLSGAVAHALDRDQEQIFDLSAMVAQVTQQAAPSAFDHAQEISLGHVDSDVMFRGNETLMREALANLVDNAIKHNDEGSSIEVQLSVFDGQIEIAVLDTGNLFSAEELLQHSQPFSTGGENTSGSGLGLSVSKDVAKSHGGHLTTAPVQGVKGKKISIVLPSS